MGCKIAAFRFEGELKQEPKYVAMETSARLTVLFFLEESNQPKIAMMMIVLLQFMYTSILQPNCEIIL